LGIVAVPTFEIAQGNTSSPGSNVLQTNVVVVNNVDQLHESTKSTGIIERDMANLLLPSETNQLADTTIPTPSRREHLSAAITSQLRSDSFGNTRLVRTNPRNPEAQQEREMVLKLRDALDLFPTGKLLGEDIPSDPGFTPLRREHLSATITSQLTSDSISNNRLVRTNPHNNEAQQER
jgi:hypothetical protein